MNNSNDRIATIVITTSASKATTHLFWGKKDINFDLVKKLFFINTSLSVTSLQIGIAIALFYISLFTISFSNISFLILSTILLSFFLFATRNLQLSLYILIIILLPFAKGKAINIILTPQGGTNHYSFFDIKYFFPLYLSFFFLFSYYSIIVRNFLSKKISLNVKIIKPYLIPLFFLINFIIINLFTVIFSFHQEVIFLSSIQVTLLALVFCSPIFLDRNTIKLLVKLLPIILACGLLFHSSWAITQKLSGAPLYKDIEAVIPGTEGGIRSSENIDLFRANGIFFEPSILGTYLLMTYNLFFLLSFNSRKMKSNNKLILFLSTTMITFLALIFTSSRVLYIIYVILLSILLKYRKKTLLKVCNRLKTNRMFFMTTIFFFFLIGILIIPTLFLRIKSLPDLLNKQGSANYRLEMMKYAFDLGKKNFTGVGISLSPYYLDELYPNKNFIFDITYPHNLIFQLFAETGFLGTTTFILFIYTGYRYYFNNYKNIKNKLIVIGLLSSSFIYLLCAQIYPIFINHPEILGHFFLYFGLGLRLTSEKDQLFYD